MNLFMILMLSVVGVITFILVYAAMNRLKLFPERPKEEKPERAKVTYDGGPSKPIETANRVALALLVFFFDLMTVGIPFAAMFLAYVIIARPPWFREWVSRLYSDRS